MKPSVRWKPCGAISIASSRLRAYIPIKILNENGWDAGIYNSSEIDFDVIVFQKAYSNSDIDLAGKLKARGKKIVFDLCDNHFYDDSSAAHPEKSVRLNRMIELSDAVVVSTLELSKLITHPHIFCIDDALENQIINRIKQKLFRIKSIFKGKKRIRLVWFGNSGSVVPKFGLISLQNIVGELNELNEVLPISLSVISNSKEKFDQYLEGAKFKKYYYEWNMKKFPYVFMAHDICLLPNDMNSFTICKTSNRLILSLQLGLPVIADVIPSYEEFLSYIYVGDWKNNIIRIAQSKEADKKVQHGQNYIEKNYNSARVLSQWTNVLNQLESSSYVKAII